MVAQLGIDVSKATLAGLLLKDGKRVQAGQFENNPTGFMQLRQVLKKRAGGQVHVCLEATGASWRCSGVVSSPGWIPGERGQPTAD